MFAAAIIAVGKVNVRTVPTSMLPLLGSTRTPSGSGPGFFGSAESTIQGTNKNRINNAHFILRAGVAADCVGYQVRPLRSGRCSSRTLLVPGGLHLIRGWPMSGFDIGWRLQNLRAAPQAIPDNTSSRDRRDQAEWLFRHESSLRVCRPKILELAPSENVLPLNPDRV